MTSRALRLLFSALSGTLLFLACADFDIWPLAWLGFVPLLVVVLDRRCQHPFFYGWLAGLLANGGGFYWINGLLERFGHLPTIAALPLFFLLIAYQAITFALFAWAVRRLRDATALPIVLLAPVAMTAIELVVPFLFPWYLAITQAWVRPVIQIADLTGPLGVSFLLVLSSAALYELWEARRGRRRLPWRSLGLASGAIVAALLYGQIRIHQVEARRAAAPHAKVGLVQANIGIHEKFVPGLREQQLALHQRLSAELAGRGADLIVWPESAYPYVLSRAQATDFPPDDARRVQRGFDRPILFGAITVGSGPYPYNTALMLDERGQFTGSFDKNFLLVFGEYIPFYEHIKWFRDLIPESSNFARGEGVATFPFRGRRLGPMICYEDIIPSFGRRLVHLPAGERPHLLVNITNDAWFGATSEPYEHLALAVYRAVEHRLDLVRAVNTGVSAFVDATGRLVEQSPAVDPDRTLDVQPQTLLADVALLDASGPYGTLGDTFGALNLLVLLGLAVLARARLGHPVGWTAVGLGVASMALLLGLGAVATGQLPAALEVIAHRPTPPGDVSRFGISLWLIAVLLFAATATGALLGRRGAARIEAMVSVSLVVIGPPLLWGRIEGETASLVFLVLAAAGMALGGVRLARRQGKVKKGASGRAPLRPPV